MAFINGIELYVFDDNDRRAYGMAQRKLIDVVDYWLQEVTRGVHLEWDVISSADALVAGFAFDRPADVQSRRHRATNVGFGLSYVLP